MKNLRIHFVHRHMRYTIVITEEGNQPHPRCPMCNMFVLWKSLNDHQPTKSLCARGDDMKCKRLEADKTQAGVDNAF